MKKRYAPSDQTNLKLMITLTRCLQSINRKEHVVWQKHGLTPAQFGVLEFLHHKGALTIKQILAGTLSSGGNLTVVIDNLEKNGFVERKSGEYDRRVKMIHLTAKGKRLIGTVFPEHIRNLRTILKCCNRQEKEALIRLTRKLGKSVATNNG